MKGGSAYNTYLSAALGGLPWLDLHSPLNSSGKPAEISHWFACGTPPTTTTTTRETTTTTSPAGSSSESTTTTTTPAYAGTTTTTTTALVVVSKPDELASTGFGSP